MKISAFCTSLMASLVLMPGTAWTDEVTHWNDVAGKASFASGLDRPH